MPSTVAVLTLPGSSLGGVLRPRIEAAGAACRILDLDAPLSGKPVTIRPRRVTWEGHDLLASGAVLVERPVFPWPQPVRVDGLPAEAEARQRALAFEREARALCVSALRVVAESVPVMNPPEACHFAAAPGAALDRAAAAGVPVAPWRLQPAGIPVAVVAAGGAPSSRSESPDALVLDAVGNDRWHVPGDPAAGQPAVVIDAPGGPVTTVLVVGDSTPASVRHENARTWAMGSRGGEPCGDIAGTVAEAAAGAARVCGLSLAAVTLGAGPAVLAVDAAPDLVAWGRITGGRAVDSVAAYLVQLADRQETQP